MKNGLSDVKSENDCPLNHAAEASDENSFDDAMDIFEIEIDIKINRIMSLKDARKIVERELITKVMESVGSTYKAAKILEVSQATIARKSKRYNDEIFDLQESN